MKRWQSILNDLEKEFQIREKELEILHEIDKHIIDERNTLNKTYSLILTKTKELLSAKYTQLLIKKGNILEIGNTLAK